MGLPHAFQAATDFTNVWTHPFELIYDNQAKITDDVHNMYNDFTLRDSENRVEWLRRRPGSHTRRKS